MPLLLLGIFAVALASRATEAQTGNLNRCYRYWMDTVTLTGTISRRVYPGPPNYESIKRGDEAEPVLLLHLQRPLCTLQSREYPARKDVREIQVLASDAEFKRGERLAGRRVTVTGTLTGPDMGYHHREVLIDATNRAGAIQPAK